MLDNLQIRLGSVFVAACLACVMMTGCATTNFFSPEIAELDFEQIEQSTNRLSRLPTETRMARLAGKDENQPSQAEPNPKLVIATNPTQPSQTHLVASATTSIYSPAKAKSPSTTTESPSTTAKQTAGFTPQQTTSAVASSSYFVRAQSPDDSNDFVIGGTPSNKEEKSETIVDPNVRQAQYPELSTQGKTTPSFGLPTPNTGSPNELNPLVQPYERGGNATFPQNYADLDIYVAETQTGRINFGGAYNSDNGIVGQFTIDERHFDITRFPRNFRELFDGTAFRGGGQTFRLELVPGANVGRYLVSFSEPYLMGTDFSFSASGYLFERRYFDWDEQRLGGRFAVGRRLTPDLQFSAGLRLESVKIDNPRLTTSDQLNESLGTSNLYLANVGLIRDTRDSPFAATTGSYFSATFSQAFGDYTYSRGDLDIRRYRLLYERPDGSGRHTLSFGSKVGFSGSSTPIFENYFAGGFSTMRGFDFRGAAPIENGVRVGGEFQWLNTVEYMFPITADDMIKGVLFCDFGTVEENIELNADNFRVAPGFGFRVSMPALGMGAPLAFDFAFPVAKADGDDEKVFSFYLGVLR